MDQQDNIGNEAEQTEPITETPQASDLLKLSPQRIREVITAAVQNENYELAYVICGFMKKAEIELPPYLSDKVTHFIKEKMLP